MIKDVGQKSTVWDNWGDKNTPLSEIRTWDFYGGRPWVLKYVPSYGKVIKDRSGFGR